MSLQSVAQELIVVDPSSMGHQMGGGEMSLIPLEVIDSPEDFPHSKHSEHEPLEVQDDIIKFDLVPGAHDAGPLPEPSLEVSEHDKDDDKAQAADEDPKAQKNEKWDWSKHGPTGFIAWVKGRCDDVPTHSGTDTAGLERAIAYLERLDNEISKAMRMDLDGELDANQIEKVRAIIDNGVERLNDRLDQVKSHKKKSRKKKSDYQSDSLVKEGQKITGVSGVMITVPLLISRIARVCINGMVSGGHDIEDLYARQVKYYKLDTREQAEVMQLLFDMGYSVRQDRGFMPDQDVDITSSDNMDWGASYKA